jgi:tetratricopeptide (TPR) repeat protein
MKSAITVLLCSVILLGFLTGTGQSQIQDSATKFRLAQTFEMSGDFERAGELYGELYRKEPGNYVFFDGWQRMLVQLKRYDEAIILVRARLEGNPADLNLRSMLAGIYQRGGREQQAREEWDRAIAMNPANANAYRIIASSMIEYRLLEKAGEVYRRGRAALNDPLLFALELAQLESVMMDYTGAATELISWLRKNPAQVAFVQNRLASFVTKPDGRRAAIAVVERSLHEQDDVHLYEILGWLYLEGKEFDLAFAAYRSIDELTHAQGGALLQFAERVLKERAFDVAAHAFQEAIRAPLSPNKIPAARYGYANALREIATHGDTLSRAVSSPSQGHPEAQSKFGEAISAYQAIIREFPHSEFSAKALYQIGMIQFESLFDLNGALTSFQKVEEEAGSLGVIRFDVALKRGVVYTARGDTARAREQFAAVAGVLSALPDQNDEANFRLAELDFFAGRVEDAITRLDSIIVNTKADYANDALRLQAFLQENASTAKAALAEYGRAELLARQKKNTEAVALLEEVVRQYPGSLLIDDALMRIAGLQNAAGLYPEAIVTYTRLLTEFQGNSIALDRARFGLGEVYEFGLHDSSKAIVEYERLLADHPRSVFVGIARKRIRLLRGDPL